VVSIVPPDEQPSLEIGTVDNSDLVRRIHVARAARERAQQAGWFDCDRELVFDFISEFGSVDEWLAYRVEKRSSSIVSPEVLGRARDLLASRGGILRVHERERISRLRAR
jgi:hypothetical protein